MALQHFVQLSDEGRGHALAAGLQQGQQVVELGRAGNGSGRRSGRWTCRKRRLNGTIRVSWRPHQPLFPMATRSKSSQRWLKEHFSDPFVKKAQAEGMRSRAAYKLEELLERDRLLKPHMVVVDLGAAPGGWSQQVRRQIGDTGRVLALDILDMPPLAGVEFLHGDFREEAVLSQFEAMLGDQPVDLVLSDMAPNKSRCGRGRPAADDAPGGAGPGFCRQPPEDRWGIPDQAVPGRRL